MKRNMVCINCPVGCMLEVAMDEDTVKVSGNTCMRGEEYAVSEIKNPQRMITTSVFVCKGTHPTVSVKTSRAMPKALILSCMSSLKGYKVEAPVRIGDVVAKDILGTGIDIVATRNVDRC